MTADDGPDARPARRGPAGSLDAASEETLDELRRSGLNEIGELWQRVRDADERLDFERQRLYAAASSLHQSMGVTWKEMAARTGLTAEALIKGSRARTGSRAVAVPGAPETWEFLISSSGSCSARVNGARYRALIGDDWVRLTREDGYRPGAPSSIKLTGVQAAAVIAAVGHARDVATRRAAGQRKRKATLAAKRRT